MWLYRDFSGENLMLLYASENIAAIFLAVIFVILFAPKQERAKKILTRREVLQNYLVAAVGLSVGSGIFLLSFIFLILKSEISSGAIISGLIWIFGFLILEFVADFIMMRPLSLTKAEIFLNRSLGRVVFLFLCVFLGIFLALFVDRWFIVPFIILKTIVDIGEQIQIFTGYGRNDENIPLAEIYVKYRR